MQNHTKLCIAFIVYKMLSHIPTHYSSLFSFYPSKNILYIPGTMLDTRDTKKWTRHTSLYIYRVHSLTEDFKVNGYKMCKEVQWGIPRVLCKWHRGTKICNEVRVSKRSDAWAASSMNKNWPDERVGCVGWDITKPL